MVITDHLYPICVGHFKKEYDNLNHCFSFIQKLRGILWTSGENGDQPANFKSHLVKYSNVALLASRRFIPRYTIHKATYKAQISTGHSSACIEFLRMTTNQTRSFDHIVHA